MWVGAARNADDVTWRWMDGSDATALNCGSTGCGPWAVGQPAPSTDVTQRAALNVHSDVVDDGARRGHGQALRLYAMPASSRAAFVCETALPQSVSEEATAVARRRLPTRTGKDVMHPLPQRPSAYIRKASRSATPAPAAN